MHIFLRHPKFRIWYVTNRKALELLNSPINHYVQSWGSEWMVRKLMSSYGHRNCNRINPRKKLSTLFCHFSDSFWMVHIERTLSRGCFFKVLCVSWIYWKNYLLLWSLFLLYKEIVCFLFVAIQSKVLSVFFKFFYIQKCTISYSF